MTPEPDVLARTRTPLEEVALRPLVTVAPDTTLGEAAARMRSADVSTLVVAGSPPGLVTERDLAHALAEGLGPTTAVAEVATSRPLWVTPTTTLGDAAALMIHHGIRHVVIVNPLGELLGVHDHHVAD
ncbi:MAG TPA: CBS domain-containing protein, partial [Acidimicrobiales bacterium]|nr:CBS domain-containing protein [Acidimicrobiales bacterium]